MASMVKHTPLLKNILTLKYLGTVPCRLSNTLPDYIVEQHRKSNLSITKEPHEKLPSLKAPRDYRYIYPEFLPDPVYYKRDRVREKLERREMLRRRAILQIPEFYVGSILAVTVADPYAPGKKNRFVGLCIQRGGHGLRAHFSLRNVIDGQGVEITYDLYNPTIQKVEVLKLEKRVDEELLFLKDAPLEYSTIPFDMEPVIHPPGTDVPINPDIVPMNPYPWSRKWELHKLKGIDYSKSGVWDKRLERAKYPQNVKAHEDYDMMKWYRESIPDYEADSIMDEVYDTVKTLQTDKKPTKKK